MEKTLCALERRAQKISLSYSDNLPEQAYHGVMREKDSVQWFKFGDSSFLALGAHLGYIAGSTKYDFNHYTSELQFPMDNWMGGGTLSLGYKNISFNADFWTPIEEYAGYEMKDKDWSGGNLISYTRSKAYMDAIIADSNLRYNFFRKSFPERDEDEIIPEELRGWVPGAQFDSLIVGALLGYRFERFDYDMFNIYYETGSLKGQTLYEGKEVLTYKIKYSLPYFGLATEFRRKNWGFGIDAKYSFYPTAKDVDNHILRGLTFYGDYDRHREAFLCNLYGFWELKKNWRLKGGADGTFATINGKTWEESNDPDWTKDQDTDLKQWIFWSGIEYAF